MDENLTIGFTLEGPEIGKYSQTSTVEVFYDLGETELDVIGTQLNCFLKQCGYSRRYDNILMADLSDEEYDALTGYLEELRREEKEPC